MKRTTNLLRAILNTLVLMLLCGGACFGEEVKSVFQE